MQTLHDMNYAIVHCLLRGEDMEWILWNRIEEEAAEALAPTEPLCEAFVELRRVLDRLYRMFPEDRWGDMADRLQAEEEKLSKGSAQ